MIARSRRAAGACCRWMPARSSPQARGPGRGMHSLRLALRALRREWHSGELAILWMSLSIAVAALSGVGFLVDRIGRAVTLQASEVLAADLRVESDAPIV